jgi:hypothetical protein
MQRLRRCHACMSDAKRREMEGRSSRSNSYPTMIESLSLALAGPKGGSPLHGIRPSRYGSSGRPLSSIGWLDPQTKKALFFRSMDHVPKANSQQGRSGT